MMCNLVYAGPGGGCPEYEERPDQRSLGHRLLSRIKDTVIDLALGRIGPGDAVARLDPLAWEVTDLEQAARMALDFERRQPGALSPGNQRVIRALEDALGGGVS